MGGVAMMTFVPGLSVYEPSITLPFEACQMLCTPAVIAEGASVMAASASGAVLGAGEPGAAGTASWGSAGGLAAGCC